MKASEILEWIAKDSINGELINIVNIPDTEDMESWFEYYFGGVPNQKVTAGKYMYLYDSDMHGFIELRGENIAPDADIDLKNEQSEIEDIIYLYKVED